MFLLVPFRVTVAYSAALPFDVFTVPLMVAGFVCVGDENARKGINSNRMNIDCFIYSQNFHKNDYCVLRCDTL